MHIGPSLKQHLMVSSRAAMPSCSSASRAAAASNAARSSRSCCFAARHAGFAHHRSPGRPQPASSSSDRPPPSDRQSLRPLTSSPSPAAARCAAASRVWGAAAVRSDCPPPAAMWYAFDGLPGRECWSPPLVGRSGCLLGAAASCGTTALCCADAGRCGCGARAVPAPSAGSRKKVAQNFCSK